MKRLPLVLTAALMLLLAACSQAPASPELTGQWEGTADGAPMSFAIQPEGQVDESSFDFRYEDENLTFVVESHATGDTITISARAENSAGDSLTFVLNGRVDGNVLSGDYKLTLTVDGSQTVLEGTFRLTRVAT